MSAQPQPLGDWVDQLFNAVFFQPDDDQAIKAYTDGVDPSLLVRVNHMVLKYDEYKEAIRAARAKDVISLQSSSEVLKWDDAEQKGGAVAHLTKFTVKDKTTGQETKNTSLILSSVKWTDNKRMLTEITEVCV